MKKKYDKKQKKEKTGKLAYSTHVVIQSEFVYTDLLFKQND